MHLPLKYRIPIMIGWAILMAVVPTLADNPIVKIVKPIILKSEVPLNEITYVNTGSTDTSYLNELKHDGADHSYYEDGGAKGGFFPLWQPRNDCFWQRGPIRKIASGWFRWRFRR